MRPFRFRGVQLDLARQKESIDFIKDFIDFIANFNYNLLVLYLEGRIKTETFPYLSKEESYDPEEMTEIVRYAKGKGIDVMPVISNLSHTEMFLRAKPLRHLAELRNGNLGRFDLANQKPYLNMFCPSLEGTYDFFAKYYTEIAEIFPFDYFHVGNDEAWDIGFCDLCRSRAEGKEGQEGIFANHLLKTYEFVTGKLGKKMVIWDDMFEHYPSALEKIPKDIVLCCWQYDDSIEIPKGHFAGHERIDWFLRYEKLGFDYFFATANTLRNIEGFTAYASKYKPLGGIITNWEKQDSFLFEHYPVIGAAGLYWSSDEKNLKTAQTESAQIILASQESNCLQALDVAMKYKPLSIKLNTNAFYFNPTTFTINERLQLNRVLRRDLAQINCKGSLNGGKVVEDLLVRLREENVRLTMLRLIPEVYGRVNKIYHGDPQKLKNEIGNALTEVNALRKIRQRQWKNYRGAFLPAKMEEKWDRLEAELSVLYEVANGNRPQDTGLLVVHYFLPDMFAAPIVKLQVLYEGIEEWQDVTCGIYKPIILGNARDNNPYFSMAYTIDSERSISKCRIQSWGYGRQGITYIEAVNQKGHFKPNNIIEVNGEIENPEALMADDLRWCFLGFRNPDLAFQNPVLAKVKHTLSVGLERI